jgi:1,5-anhydro-D-fructose reductase (1,5-anhydro-D-mannitol-forming)
MSPLRWGLIGASDIAATRMIPAMRRLGHQVTAVGASTPEWGATYAAQNDIAVAGAVADVVARDDVDAVYISTKNEFHRDQALLAAAAGKHVLCEKPLALTAADGEAMVAACAAAGVVFGTNHHLPGADTHRTIRELVRDGAVGRVLSVRVFHAVKLPERLQGWRLASKDGGGVTVDITCHDASVLNPLLGGLPIDVAAIAASQGRWEAEVEVEDAIMTVLRYPDGVLAQTHDAFTITHAPTGVHVLGEDGSIFATNVMTQDPTGTVVLRDAAGEREIDIPDRRGLYEIVLDGFAAAVRGDAAQPVVTGQDGLDNTLVALAVRQSAETGERVSL